MAPTKASIYKIYNAGSRKFSPLKNTIKFLSFCQDKRIHKDILSRAPPIVIKRICDAALNARQGQVKLSKKQKDTLTRHRKTIEQLLQKAIPVERKRKILVQRGGGIAALIIPIILSSVLGALGSDLFKK